MPLNFISPLFTAIMDFVKQLDTRLVLIITLAATIKFGGVKFNDQLISELCGLFRALWGISA